MIRRIELVNFMSHTHTVIEPAAGLTVLFGPNNCGKSAVVAALQILCHNDSSTFVTRHNERECRVEIETDDGHIIQWRRKNAPAYTIDGTRYDRLGIGGLPDGLHDLLRLPKVLAEGNQSFDVHFGEQKSPIFLLDKPASHAAQFFASSSDAARLVEMQKRHQQKSTEARRDRARLELRRESLSNDLANLEPIDAINLAVAELEKQHADLLESATHAAQLARDLKSLQVAADALQRYKEYAAALAALPAPPRLIDPAPLEHHIRQLARTKRDVSLHFATADALQQLTPVPDVAEERTLISVIKQIGSLATALAHAANDCTALDQLLPAPGEKSTDELKQLLNQLQMQQQRVTQFESRLATLDALQQPPAFTSSAELSLDLKSITGASNDLKLLSKQVADADEEYRAAAEALRNFAIEAQVCPTCGAALDPEGLIGHAGAHAAGDLNG